MIDQDLEVKYDIDFFDSYEERVINNVDKFIENKKNDLFLDYTKQNLLTMYYENLFIEKLILTCWCYIDKFCYRNSTFLTKDNLLLQIKIDFSYLCTVKIYILCPTSNFKIIEKSVTKDDQSIVDELQKIVDNILSHYENKN